MRDDWRKGRRAIAAESFRPKRYPRVSKAAKSSLRVLHFALHTAYLTCLAMASSACDISEDVFDVDEVGQGSAREAHSSLVSQQVHL